MVFRIRMESCPNPNLRPVAERLHDLNLSLKLGDSHQNPVPVQIVVALVERMVTTTTTTNSDGHNDQEPITNEDTMAEHMARAFHDAWGVGQVTESGGTGILIFVSIYDRVVYISRGGALDRILTPGRLDTILYHSRSTMRQAKYAEALMDIITDLSLYVEQGEPTWKEKVLQLFQMQNLFLLVWLGIFIHGVTSAHRQRQQQQAYARAASQLSEIDRAQARALQGQYEATSCPICLERFESSTIGSDHQPLKLLRCGHVFDESCWSEWVSTGQGNVTKCPICKMDIGRPVDEPNNNGVGLAFQQGTIQETRENDHYDNDDGDQMLVLRRFQQERNFRLIRLGMRYPSLISQSQIQQWSSPTYNGSLARDPNFQQRAPQQGQSDGMRGTSSTTGGSYRPMSFGGGTSSGGRAGRF